MRSDNRSTPKLTRMRNRKSTLQNFEEKAIDEIVTAEADDDLAWDAPVRVTRPNNVSLSIPAELAARAVFLANVHDEPRIDKCIERIVRERVEIEELVHTEAKKRLAS